MPLQPTHNGEFFPFEVVTEDDVLKARFFANCRLAESGCWIWTGKKTDGGYGYLGRKWLAHRLSHHLFKGPVPAGLHVLHSCDNPPCCNPAHLRAGTRQENVADCISRGRFRKSQGALNNLAKLTDADVIDIRNSTLSHAELAQKFGIDRTNVHFICNGTTWTHVPMPAQKVTKADGRAKLTRDQVMEIRNTDRSVVNSELGRRFDVGIPLVSMIRNGRIWKNVVVSAQESVNAG